MPKYKYVSIMMRYNKDKLLEVLSFFCRHSLTLITFGCLLAVVGCGKKPVADTTIQEDKKAKEMLQGIWLNEDADDVAFRVKGDTIYYPDSTSSPMYFYIYSDTLVMKGANEVKYPIVKQAAHLFEFKNQGGDIIKLVKTSDKSYLEAFQQNANVAVNQNQLIKRDTVVAVGADKYHLYVQINPTSYKVYKSSFNDDGVQIDNVYFDNIINLNIFHGARKLFGRDFHKNDFAKKVPEEFLKQSILSDIVFLKTDEAGIHYQAVLAIPDSNMSFQVEVIISKQGKMSMKV